MEQRVPFKVGKLCYFELGTRVHFHNQYYKRARKTVRFISRDTIFLLDSRARPELRPGRADDDRAAGLRGQEGVQVPDRGPLVLRHLHAEVIIGFLINIKREGNYSCGHARDPRTRVSSLVLS